MFKHKKPKYNRFAAAAGRYQQIYVDNETSNASLLQSEYPHRLNFYLKPPPAEISIEEFEQFALDRLQVLKTFETAAIRNKRGPEFKKEVDRVLEKHLPLKSNLSKSPNLYEERRKDHISHFVLRMAYCRSEDLRQWFLRQECALFRYRFEQELAEDKKQFVASLNMSWSILEPEEKEEIMDQLEVCAAMRARQAGQSARNLVQSETYFKVDFEKVPDLVGRRSVYIAKGKAYVPMFEQVSLAMEEFKAHLSKALEATAKALPRMEEDERLKPILLNVEKQYVGRVYGDNASANGSVKAGDVDALVHHHAPLCMKNLHEALRANHHLRNGGRMQYGLFLKAIGLSVEEALLFWRTAFSSFTDDKFQKEYAYNIRHSYGLEGKRVSYAAYSCIKIIQGNPPSTGDHHGCPFRHFSHENLATRLYRDKFSAAQVNEILDLVRNRHYQIACTKYYEFTHPQQTDKIDAIEHPNQYFEASKSASAANDAETNGDAMEVDR